MNCLMMWDGYELSCADTKNMLGLQVGSKLSLEMRKVINKEIFFAKIKNYI